MPFLFLGVGNRHRGDDGVGPLVAEWLVKDGRLGAAGAEVLPHSGEGVSLMQLWEGAETAVVVDAMKSDGKRGEVRRFDVAEQPLQSGVFRYSSHLFGLAEAVEMARALGKLPPRLIIYGIEGTAFSFDTPVSQPVQRAARQVMAQVIKDFEDWQGRRDA